MLSSQSYVRYQTLLCFFAYLASDGVHRHIRSFMDGFTAWGEYEALAAIRGEWETYSYDFAKTHHKNEGEGDTEKECD